MSYPDVQDESQNNESPSKPKITILKRRSEQFTADRLRALKTAEEVGPLVHVKPERLRYYADGNMCPHYRVEDEPLFDLMETQSWVARNLLRHHDCNADLQVTVSVGLRKPKLHELPSEIRLFANSLREISNFNVPAVYFLCYQGEVVYVGQSVRPYSRIDDHRAAGKTFDKVYIFPCPESELDLLESMMIHALEPTLNARYSSGEMVAPFSQEALEIRKRERG